MVKVLNLFCVVTARNWPLHLIWFKSLHHPLFKLQKISVFVAIVVSNEHSIASHPSSSFTRSCYEDDCQTSTVSNCGTRCQSYSSFWHQWTVFLSRSFLISFDFFHWQVLDSLFLWQLKIMPESVNWPIFNWTELFVKKTFSIFRRRFVRLPLIFGSVWIRFIDFSQQEFIFQSTDRIKRKSVDKSEMWRSKKEVKCLFI